MIVAVALIGGAFALDQLLHMRVLSGVFGVFAMLIMMKSLFAAGHAHGQEDAWKEKYLVGSITRNPQDDPLAR
jgi:hypothetical protein